LIVLLFRTSKIEKNIKGANVGLNLLILGIAGFSVVGRNGTTTADVVGRGRRITNHGKNTNNGGKVYSKNTLSGLFGHL
jgi:hypothetical protein